MHFEFDNGIILIPVFLEILLYFSKSRCIMLAEINTGEHVKQAERK
jgi:hypothetical protein